MDTNIQVKSSSGISLVPLSSRLMTERKIFIEGSIDHETALDFVKKVMYLNSEDSSAPIDVFVNSHGGEINSGMLMYDVIESSSAPIRMFCIGCAYSMAALLFAGGRHGRYMLPNSKLMIHEPLLGNSVSGNASSIKSISETLLENKKLLVDILVEHSGKSEEEVEKALSFDNFMTAQESIDFGICDSIVTFDQIMKGDF